MTGNAGSLNPTSVGMWLAAVNGVDIFVMANVRRRTLSLAQIGPSAEAIFASFNVWPPIYLFLFVTDTQKRLTLPASLTNYDIYIAFAAISSFLVTITGIVSGYLKAWKV